MELEGIQTPKVYWDTSFTSGVKEVGGVTHCCIELNFAVYQVILGYFLNSSFAIMSALERDTYLSVNVIKGTITQLSSKRKNKDCLV